MTASGFELMQLLGRAAGCSLSCVDCEAAGAANNTCAYTCVFLWPHTYTRDKTGDET